VIGQLGLPLRQVRGVASRLVAFLGQPGELVAAALLGVALRGLGLRRSLRQLIPLAVKPLGLLKSRVALLPQAFRRAAEDHKLGAERLAVLLGLPQSRRQPVLHALIVGDRPVFLLMPARGSRERLSLVLPLRDEFLPFDRPEAAREFELVEMVEAGRFEPGVRLVEGLLDLSQHRLEAHDFFEDGLLTLGIVSNMLLARRHQLSGGSPDPLQVRRTRGELVPERPDDPGKLGDLGAGGLKFALGEVRRLDVSFAPEA
jgi:hypothetical protein